MRVLGGYVAGVLVGMSLSADSLRVPPSLNWPIFTLGMIVLTVAIFWPREEASRDG